MSIPVYDIEGMRINRVLDRMGESFDVDVTAPGSDKLFNFVVEGTGFEPLLVLDPYGDDTMPEKMRERVFLTKDPFTVAIERETGFIRIVTFEPSSVPSALPPFERTPLPIVRGQSGSPHGSEPSFAGSFLEMHIHDAISGMEPVQPRIPPRWLPHINQLLTKKRPYKCFIDPLALEDFIDQEVGWYYLRLNVVFQFDFHGDSAEVKGDQYRVVGAWACVGPALRNSC
jgi:hypothetical protein